MTISDYIILTMILIVSIIVACMFGSVIFNALQKVDDMGNASCSNIIITDKFTTNSGGMFGSSTEYYITDDKNSTYLMWISGNITEIKQWRDIVIGNSYNIQHIEEDAEFCN